MFVACSAIVVCLLVASVDISNSGLYDFGAYPANQRKEFSFRITNQDIQDLYLGKIHSTCGCLVGKLSKKTLKKGETAEVSVQIKESSVTGTYAKSIYIETSNPQLRFLRLRLTGEAIPLLKVQRDSLLYIGNVQSGKEHCYQFRITPVDSSAASQIKLKFPDTLNHKQAKVVLSFDTKSWILTAKLTPINSKTFLNIAFDVSITEPAGWPPVHFKIYGKVQ